MSHSLGKYMTVTKLERKPGAKTDRWGIDSRSNGARLGWISWYSPWRCYVFSPAALTVFNSDCLQSIETFLRQKTKEQREGTHARTQQETR